MPINGRQAPTSTLVASGSPIDAVGLQDHINGLAEEVSKRPDPVPAGKLGDAAFYAHYNTLLKEAELRLTDHVEDPYPCLQVVTEGQSITIGTLGNFFVITGKAKSRKTFFLSLIAAALLKRNTVADAIRRQLPADKTTVLYFDTEQISGHVMRVMKRISALSGDETLFNLRVIRLRKFLTQDRINAIKVAIEQTPNLGAIIIDGIRDTVFDINDAREATERATDLLQWTEENGAHLVTVIHENKGNNSVRGHLGTELVNKAESVVSVSLNPEDKQQSVVTSEFCRDKEFEPFIFSVDENGLPYLVGNAVVNGSTSTRIRKPTVDTMKPEDILAFVKRAFSSDEHLRYTQLRTNIIEASVFFGVTLAKTRSEEFIRRVETNGYLTKGKLPGQKYEHYKINLEKLSS
ncbi:AAA family ATPase [Spirosoma jeollabukense]